LTGPVDVQTLKDQLAGIFDLICFVDLADLRYQHRAPFDLFRRCYKKSYSATERLILYSSQPPEQSFLNHLQRAAVAEDISNFFILFVCPYDLADALEIANAQHGHDSVRMQNQIRALTETKPFSLAVHANLDFLCPLPFMAADINANKVRPCCKYQGSCGDLTENSLRDIFLGTEYELIRQQMIRGEPPAGCAECLQAEKFGSTSLRQYASAKHQELLDHYCVDQPHIEQVNVICSSVCNFKCRICEANLSTSIRSEKIRLAKTQKEKQEIKLAFPLIDSSKQVEAFDDVDLAPRHLHVLGGEPFLWPGLPDLMQNLIKTKRASDINLLFNTNGSIYPKFLDHIAANFKTVKILVSIDATGPRFEVQRGGKWLTVLENLEKFANLAHSGVVKVELGPTVNIQNLLYLDDIVALARDLAMDIVWCYLEIPSVLCIDNVTNAVKRAVKDRYQNHADQELRSIAQRITQTPAVSGRAFLDYIRQLDQIRNQDFFQSHSEICELMASDVREIL